MRHSFSVFNEDIWAAPLVDFLVAVKDSPQGKRGRAYATEGRIIELEAVDVDVIGAAVEGSEEDPYDTVLSVVDGSLESNCSCPFGIDCKHAYALALALVGSAYRRQAPWTLSVLQLLPVEWRAGRWSGLEGIEGDLDELFGAGGQAMPLIVAPRSADAQLSAEALSPEWWLDYLNADTAIARQTILKRVTKARLAEFFAPWYIEDFLRQFERFEGPIEQLRRFESSLAEFARRNGRKPPAPDPGLQAFLASDEARALEQGFYRRQMERALLQWLEPKGARLNAERAHIEVVWTAVPGQSNELPSLCFQFLLTSKKLRSSPRSPHAIDQLNRDLEYDRRQMSPIEERLVRWIVRGNHTQAGYSYMGAGDSTHIPVRNALEWVTTWTRHGLLRWSDGGPVVFDPTPAGLTVSADDEGTPVWSVELPPYGDDPGGRVPVTQVEIMADRGQSLAYSYSTLSTEDRKVYVRRGDVLRLLETGGMPLQLLAGARRAPEVPVERLRGTRAGAMLAQRLSLRHDDHTSTALVEEVSVRPIVECRLDDGSVVHMQARAQGPGAAFLWNHAGAWEFALPDSVAPHDELENVADEAAPEAAPADPAPEPREPSRAIAVVPRREEIEPVSEWLNLVSRHAKYVTAEDGTPLLEWRVKGKDLFELLHLWSERPRNATFLGNRAFRNLVTPGRIPPIRVHTEPSGADWLKVSVEMEQEIDALPFDEILAALQAAQSELVYLSGGRLFHRKDLDDYTRNVEVLEEMGIELRPGEQRLHAMQLAGVDTETLSEMSDADEHLRGLADRARDVVQQFEGVPAADVPAPTDGFLRPYQRAGADFLVWTAKTFGGAVLADDMGLGKTLQMLAAISALRRQEKDSLPSLVVCPASVAHNWQREAKRFAPDLRVVVIERGAGRKEILEHLEDYDLVIKNYALTRRDAEILRGQEWLAICVDEAQAIKNPGAEITRTVKSLPAKYRFALTGTPIENRLTDLWSIVDFVIPGYLHTLARFEKRLRGPNAKALHRVVRARLRPVLLRRAKAEVAPELPPRIEERRDCEMPASQRKAYLAEVQKTRLLLDGFSPNGKKAAQDKIRMLAALTRLRQICCDPALVGLPDKGSGKVDQLLELLPGILERGHKVLLFSQFVRMLKRLETKLKAHKIPTRMLTGETTRRQDLVDAFEADPEPSVFLISLKAGGVGLNLPSASYVILFDPWWNPAVEAQAIDRTHRIGQNKTVIAFRLVATGTVEERILELQESKRGIVSEVLEEEAFNRSLTKDDFAFLLNADL